MMATRVLADVEYTGMFTDREYLNNLLGVYSKKISDCEASMRKLPELIEYERKRIDQVKRFWIRDIKNEIKELKANGASSRVISTREQKLSRFLAGEVTTKKDKELLEPINFNSSKQLAELFFYDDFGLNWDILEFTQDKITKKFTTTPSLAEETLLKYKVQYKHPILDHLLELRGLTKLNSTYVVGMWEKLHTNNRIHGSFLIHGCITGDTKLVCKHGDIEISSICPNEIGDKNIEDKNLFILSHDGTWEHITHGINKGKQKVYKVVTSHGDEIKCTKEHKFLTLKGMRKLSYILRYDIPLIMNDISYLKEIGLPKIKGKKYNKIEFKDIEGFPGYLVSNTGKVYSIKIKGGQGNLDYNNPHEIVPRVVRGYNRVGLRKGDRKRYNKKVSTLVWESFRGKIPKGLQVDHIDHDRINDDIRNLQLLTPSENIKKNYKNIRTSFTKGGINGYSKLNTLTVGKIINELRLGSSQIDIANKYNISQKQVSRIFNNEAWSNIYIAKVTKCEYIGEEDIYDLSVNNKHSYVTTSNFINSNTVTGRLSSRNPNLQNIPRDCVDYNTKIITNKGIKVIGDLFPKEGGSWEIGESDRNLLVLTHTGEYKAITHLIQKPKRHKMIKVTFEDGSFIICTEGHTMLTKDYGWQKVRDIIDNNLEVLKW